MDRQFGCPVRYELGGSDGWAVSWELEATGKSRPAWDGFHGGDVAWGPTESTSSDRGRYVVTVRAAAEKTKAWRCGGGFVRHTVVKGKSMPSWMEAPELSAGRDSVDAW
ncbi:hypothetical protein M0R45_016107 [Rubus argutus]|uniref:Uncharacterized protein n=1 Tax=Rubus argutus TaxID=59490 RepID=A0AAW1XSQ2_RUBAR